MIALSPAISAVARASGASAVLIGAGLGLHLRADAKPVVRAGGRSCAPDLRGTAFGVFNLVSGVALLVASGLAGLLWDLAGPAWTFYAGAAFTLVAWIGMLRAVATCSRSKSLEQLPRLEAHAELREPLAARHRRCGRRRLRTARRDPAPA